MALPHAVAPCRARSEGWPSPGADVCWEKAFGTRLNIWVATGLCF